MLNRVASTVFVLVQVACSRWLGLTTLGISVPLIIIALAFVIGDRIQIGKRLHAVLVSISAVALWGPLLTSDLTMVDANRFAQAFAQFLLALQSLEIVRQRSGADTNYLPGLGTIAFSLMMLSSDQVLGYRMTMQLTIAFMIALVWVQRPELPLLFFGDSLMRHKGNTLLMLLSGVWLIGSLAERQLSSQLPALQQQVEAMRGVQIDMVSSQRVAGMTPLVDHVGLNSQVDEQLDAPDTILFEVAGEHPPGYMRTLSFTQFDGERWRNRWDGHGRQGTELKVVQPATQPPKTQDNFANSDDARPWFHLANQSQTQRHRHWEVFIPYGRGALVPVPVGCEWIQCKLNARTSVLLLDVHSNIWPGSINNLRYGLLTPESSQQAELTKSPPSKAYLASLLSIPASEQIWLDRLKPTVFSSQDNFEQACRDVENFFIDQFQYATENDIEQVRGTRSKLQTFIEDRKAAHCEYFAAATVLLLRSQSIPARLSTGYLVYELDNDEEDFAARKRNAHAWAEAFDANSQRWRVVESTPGTDEYIQRFATPELRKAESERQAAADSKYSVGLWLEQIWDWGIAQAWSFFLWQHSWIVITLLILTLLSYRMFQYTHRYDGRRYSREARRADRLAKRLGYQRSDEETCLRFAYRLAKDQRPKAQQLANWYFHHSQNRYQV